MSKKIILYSVLVFSMLGMAAADTVFFEGFESGSFTEDWNDISQSSSSPEVNDDRSYEGTYSLDLYASPGSSTANRLNTKDFYKIEPGMKFQTYLKMYLDDGCQNSASYGIRNSEGEALASFSSSCWSDPYLGVRTYSDGNPHEEKEIRNTEFSNNWEKVSIEFRDNEVYFQAGSDSAVLDIPENYYQQGDARIRLNTNGWGSGHAKGTAWDNVKVIDNTNSDPYKPTNPAPQQGAEEIGTDTSLEADVSDPDSDKMNVTFYNASNGAEIATDTGVNSGSTASVQWEGLEVGTTHRWYAVADDGSQTEKSETWNFTTQNEPEVDESSVSPSSEETIPDETTLSFDASHDDGDTMYVTFFVNGSVVGADQEITGSGTASVTPENLNASSFYTWHAVVEDQEGNKVNTEDSNWNFTTKSGNPDAEIVYGDGKNYNPNSVIIDVKTSHDYAEKIDQLKLLNNQGTVVDKVQNVETGKTISLLWEGLEQDRRYNWTVQVKHDGETFNTNKFNLTTLTVGINLAYEIENAEKYNIYRREGLETESANFDYGNTDYTYIGSDTSIELIDASESLSEGDYCYLATSENMRDESPPSNEFCIQDVSLR